MSAPSSESRECRCRVDAYVPSSASLPPLMPQAVDALQAQQAKEDGQRQSHASAHARLETAMLRCSPSTLTCRSSRPQRLRPCAAEICPRSLVLSTRTPSLLCAVRVPSTAAPLPRSWLLGRVAKPSWEGAALHAGCELECMFSRN